MVKYHPNQQVYFNYLADHDDMSRRFTLDYWGLGYKTLLEEILEKDDRAKISIRAMNYPGVANINFLPPAARNRIKIVWHVQVADYDKAQDLNQFLTSL